jgi:hypothetical protein
MLLLLAELYRPVLFENCTRGVRELGGEPTKAERDSTSAESCAPSDLSRFRAYSFEAFALRIAYGFSACWKKSAKRLKSQANGFCTTDSGSVEVCGSIPHSSTIYAVCGVSNH